uniref:Uncharacterized protein n=1 Tax=Ditylenchus dipsaci TaxID=166011 RepID=A0A915D8C5_9BILA
MFSGGTKTRDISMFALSANSVSRIRLLKQLDRKRLEAESRAELSPRGRMQKHNWKMKQELLSQKNEGKQWHAGGRKLGLIQTKERRHQKNEIISTQNTMTDIAKPEFRKSAHRPILRTQLSVPNVADIPPSKNPLKSITLSGHEPFSVSFTQKFSYRDQPPSPGTIFLGCSLQEPEPGVSDTCTPPLSAAILGQQLSSSVTSINSLVQEGGQIRE